MFCINCGKQIADNSKFCSNCGQVIAQPNNSMPNPAVQNNMGMWQNQAPQGQNLYAMPAYNTVQPQKNNLSLVVKILSFLVLFMCFLPIIGVNIKSADTVGYESGVYYTLKLNGSVKYTHYQKTYTLRESSINRHDKAYDNLKTNIIAAGFATVVMCILTLGAGVAGAFGQFIPAAAVSLLDLVMFFPILTFNQNKVIDYLRLRSKLNVTGSKALFIIGVVFMLILSVIGFIIKQHNKKVIK